MNNIKPAGSPNCWGRLYQDGEDECRQCRFRNDCKTEVLNMVNKPGVRLPMFGQYATPVAPMPPSRMALPALPPPSSTVIPLPPRPHFAPPSQQTPPARTIPQAPLPPSTTTYQTSAGGYSLPNPGAPNPLSSWYRPGAPGPAYHFTQYPEESVGSRLAKNAILRALEAIFGELMQFFRHWTWPPKAD
jgi:hypothetical protein